MAWRIGDNVVRGEIDNRIPGIVTGEIYLEGLREPIALELEGNCYPDLAGRHLMFRNPMPVADEGLASLDRIQCGEAGEITGNRMVRIPTVPHEEFERCLKEQRPFPTRWSESLYLEWFSGNGRVLIEDASYTCQLSPAKWRLSEEQHRRQFREREAELDEMLAETGEDGFPEGLEESNQVRINHLPAVELAGLEVGPPPALVRRANDFLLRIIFECRARRFFTEDALESQPLEALIEASARATLRLARGLSDTHRRPFGLERAEVVRKLKLARWSMREASEHAGVARHMGSADAKWLRAVQEEFRELRTEVRRLILDFEEPLKTAGEPESVESPA